MKLIAICIFVLLSSLSASSQPRSLFLKGLDSYIEGKENKALRYFKRSFRDVPGDRAFSLEYIAHIEYKRGLIKEAEQKYESVVTTYKDDDHYAQYIVNLKLADIYYNRGDYNGALKWLRASEEHKNKYGCGTGKYEQEYTLRYKYARCFDALNQPDSAIKRLSLFMFKDCPLMTNQHEHIERNNFYYRLLVKKYGLCEVQDELEHAMNTLYYSCAYDSSLSWSRDPKMKRFQCSLDFFGETIPILDIGYSGKVEYYPFSKQGCIELIKKSVLYGLIMGGRDL